MKHWLVLLPMMFILLFTSCAPAPKEIIVQTATATITIAANWTKIPTATPSPPEMTATPEATATPKVVIDENDLEPHYTLSVDEIIFGAHITGGISSDESLAVSNPPIFAFSLSESAAALYVTRVIHEVFEHQNPGISYNDYMKMIGEVQKAVENNEPVDSSKIAILAYANDKIDGNGYVQQQYYIIPWYSGPLPEEIDGIPAKAVKDIDVNLVRASRVDNITMINEGFDWGFGTNINLDSLELYVSLIYGTAVCRTSSRSTAGQLARLPWWFINNEGRDIKRNNVDPNENLYNFLRGSGFAVKPPRP